MKKTLYLECNSGISGDMTVGALLDLGADRKVLEDALASLGVDGYHLHFGTTEKCGIKAYDFDVHLEYEEHVHEHCHDHDHEHTHDHGDHDHDHGDHDHDHEHTHDHGHTHDHMHPHTHRNLYDIYTIIDRLQSSDKVKQLARRILKLWQRLSQRHMAFQLIRYISMK